MRTSPESTPATNCTNRLAALWPGTMSWPSEPPSNAFALTSRRKSLSSFVGPWQEWQCFAKIGSMSRTKSTSPEAGGGRVAESAGGSAAGEIEEFAASIRRHAMTEAAQERDVEQPAAKRRR